MRNFGMVLLVICSVQLTAQDGAINGTVTNKETGEPEPYCNVGLFKDGVMIAGAETWLDGGYSIKGVAPGEYTVECTSSRSKPVRLTQMIGPDTVTTIDISIIVCELDSMPLKECPHGHSDRIIEIQYGLVVGSKKEIRRLHREAKKEKIILAGCDVPPCPEYYYCKKHNVAW